MSWVYESLGGGGGGGGMGEEREIGNVKASGVDRAGCLGLNCFLMVCEPTYSRALDIPVIATLFCSCRPGKGKRCLPSFSSCSFCKSPYTLSTLSARPSSMNSYEFPVLHHGPLFADTDYSYGAFTTGFLRLPLLMPGLKSSCGGK